MAGMCSPLNKKGEKMYYRLILLIFSHNIKDSIVNKYYVAYNCVTLK